MTTPWSSSRHGGTWVVLLLIAAAMLFFCSTTTNAFDLASVSERATLKFHQTGGLDTLNDDGSTNHRIEVRTHLGRGFVLDLQTSPSSTPLTSTHRYEEVIHDVSKSNSLSEPHLTIITHSAPSIDKCLYHGRVSGQPNSVVSLNTCTGAISGMIHVGDELFSIEPVSLPEHRSVVNNNNNNNNRVSNRVGNTLSMASMRELATAGNLNALVDNTPEVMLVDVHAETRSTDRNVHHHHHTNTKHLNVDSIDAQSTTDNIDETDQYPTCASDVEKHHLPADIARKIGVRNENVEDVLARINNHNLEGAKNSSSLATLADEGLSHPTRYVEIVLYHDNARLRRFNTTEGLTRDELIAAAREDGIALYNNMRAYYLQSNFRHTINLVLVGHVFFAGGDPYNKYLARDRKIMVISNYGLLETFNKYRRAYSHDYHDVGVLLSGNSFQSNIMGVANVGSLCGGTRWNGNINSITYRNIVKSSVLVCHEIGHTLAANHDARPGYIMNPYVSSDTTFSPRSIQEVDSHLEQTRCTVNPPQSNAMAFGHGDGVESGIPALITGSHDINDDNAIGRSRIYSENLYSIEQRPDYVEKDLVSRRGGYLFGTAPEFSLPQDEDVLVSAATAISGVSPVTTTEGTFLGGKSGLSTLEIAAIIGSSVFATCGLTALVIIMALRSILKTPGGQKLFGPDGDKTSNESFSHDLVHEQHQQQQGNELTTPTTTTTNNLQFTPRPQNKTLAFNTTDLSPNTPRVTTAATSPYSASVRQRQRRPSEILEVHDNDLINIEGNHASK